MNLHRIATRIARRIVAAGNCKNCRGSGWVNLGDCPECGGTGNVPDKSVIENASPAIDQDGQNEKINENFQIRVMRAKVSRDGLFDVDFTWSFTDSKGHHTGRAKSKFRWVVDYDSPDHEDDIVFDGVHTNGWDDLQKMTDLDTDDLIHPPTLADMEMQEILDRDPDFIAWKKKQGDWLFNIGNDQTIMNDFFDTVTHGTGRIV